MIFLYIILGLLLIILLALVIPIKIELKYELSTNLNGDKSEQLNTLNYVNIYILYFIKIKSIQMNNKQKTKENSGNTKAVFDIIYKFILEFLNFQKMDQALLNPKDLKKITNNMYFEKIDLNLGINFKDVIRNAYIISTLNALINMYFAKNADKINLENTSYLTYISNKIFNIKVNSIIRLKLVNTIIVIIKIIIRFRKVVKKDGRTTSNRKLNDDSYDFT